MQKTRPTTLLRLLTLILLLAGTGALCADEDMATVYPQIREFFPQAIRFGGFEGKPPAAPVYDRERVIGYLFFTHDVLELPAYSGKPIDTLVGIDLEGRVTGLAIVHHEEPILAVGIQPERLRRFTDQYRGKSAFDRIAVGAKREGYVQVDTISGATITVMVQNATVMRSARQVAESRGIQSSVSAAEPGLPALRLPAMFRAPSPEEPVWTTVWRGRVLEIALLLVGLVILTLILIFQDSLARRPRLVTWVRNAFLLYTLIFLGWYALAQLTVINALTFVHALTRQFNWEQFLIDPMLFILWSFVAVTLLLWGRGVYCGWLCPFGALQELVNKIAQRFKAPQLEFPEVVHERLWAVKYVILILLFGVSLQSMGEAAIYAEVEPFKTTFGLRFAREWPFVLYAGALIAITMFNRKFFCKYLCPLGAALAIPGRFRLFDWWLRRRKECGKPCQTCHHDCPVRAIRSTGEINANECHYCLDCQVLYYDDRKCPPLIEQRRRREAARELKATIGPYGGNDNGEGNASARPPG